MAISIVFGLALGTLLILFVVPSMILMLENLNAILAGRKRST
jgi:multidrug efflux pump subunit AcrB